jgi:hypothetical protein
MPPVERSTMTGAVLQSHLLAVEEAARALATAHSRTLEEIQRESGLAAAIAERATRSHAGRRQSG